MKRVLAHVLCLVMTFAVGLSSSWLSTLLRSDRTDITPVNVITTTEPVGVPESMPDSPIRHVDFANFTYPSDFVEGSGGFKVRNGKLLPGRKTKIGQPLDTSLVLSDVTYGDVTGDGVEEAIVDLGVITGGSAIPDLVYIYTMRKGKPKLLWAFETGDRADGGYKKVFAENGRLVVELKGKTKIIGKNLYEDDGTGTGDCCATHFTRTRYEWSNNRFRKLESEVLPLNR